MSDDKTKKKADRKRVALSQEHERAFLLVQLDSARKWAAYVHDQAAKAAQYSEHVGDLLIRIEARLRAGYPAKRAARKRGKP